MISPKLPPNENGRLFALDSYAILDTLPEKEYDDITALAALICDTPMSLISLIDKDRQWFKSYHGLSINESPREFAFCAHAINEKDQTLIVSDTRKDERFKNNPFVTADPNVIFYAGVPLVNPEGHPLGTLCVLDTKAKQLSAEQQNALEILSNQLMKLMELRKTTLLLHQNIKKLNAKNKTLNKFVSVAAHDIKSPINNVLALSDLLLDDYAKGMDPEAVELLEHIHTSALHSTNLIDGILEYSKDPNNISEQQEPIHIKSFLREMKELLVTNKNIQMTIEVADSAYAFMNKTALQQIFSNLISNSIKYNHQDIVKIKIQVTEDASQFKISVKDNGLGIQPKDKKRIFKLFSTTANKDTDGFHGTGIGLATVKNLVQSLGGKISVISEQDEGANFVFTLQKTMQFISA